MDNGHVFISALQFNNHGGIDLLWKCCECTWLRWRKIVSTWKNDEGGG